MSLPNAVPSCDRMIPRVSPAIRTVIAPAAGVAASHGRLAVGRTLVGVRGSCRCRVRAKVGNVRGRGDETTGRRAVEMGCRG